MEIIGFQERRRQNINSQRFRFIGCNHKQYMVIIAHQLETRFNFNHGLFFSGLNMNLIGFCIRLSCNKAEITCTNALTLSFDGGSKCGPGKYLLISLQQKGSWTILLSWDYGSHAYYYYYKSWSLNREQVHQWTREKKWSRAQIKWIYFFFSPLSLACGRTITFTLCLDSNGGEIGRGRKER